MNLRFISFLQPKKKGIYEMNVPLLFSLLMKLGCVCSLKKTSKFKEFDTYDLADLEQRNDVEYLARHLPKVIYLFVHFNAHKLIVGFFIPLNSTAQIFVLDSVRTNAMPNLSNLLNAEREKRLKCGVEEDLLPSANHKFDVKVEVNEQKVYKALDKSLQMYKDEKRGATYLLLQSNIAEKELKQHVPMLDEFPVVNVNVKERAGLFNVLDWQKV
jgi:DNA polymerase epsilon subunit 1